MDDAFSMATVSTLRESAPASFVDRSMIVHVAWCCARGLWLAWTQPLHFWRIIRPEVARYDVSETHLRTAVRRGWRHMLVERARGRCVSLPPLPGTWELVVHPPRDEINAFKVPS